VGDTAGAGAGFDSVGAGVSLPAQLGRVIVMVIGMPTTATSAAVIMILLIIITSSRVCQSSASRLEQRPFTIQFGH
jgi:hypothetical protein